MSDVEQERVTAELREQLDAARQALRKIVDQPINEDASAAWHFAEVRRIARAALGVARP